METLFENEFTFTKKAIREIILGTMSKKYKLKNISLIIVFAVVGTFGCFSTNQFIVVICATMVACAIYLSYSYLFAIFKVADRMYIQYSSPNGGKDIVKTVKFNNDSASETSIFSGKKENFDYDDILKLTISKHFYVVSFKNKRMTVLDKNLFSIGNPKDFEKFIIEKIKLKTGMVK